MRTIKLLILGAWLALGTACMTDLGVDESAPAPTASDELPLGEATSDLTAQPLCGDIPNQTFVTPESCNKNGQLGIRQCSQTCTLHRSIRFTPTGYTCEITSSTCGPKTCGPCVVVEPQGPLG